MHIHPAAMYRRLLVSCGKGRVHIPVRCPVTVLDAACCLRRLRPVAPGQLLPPPNLRGAAEAAMALELHRTCLRAFSLSTRNRARARLRVTRKTAHVIYTVRPQASSPPPRHSRPLGPRLCCAGLVVRAPCPSARPSP